MKNRTLCGLISVGALCVTATSASASLIVFNSVDNFLAEKPNVLLEDVTSQSVDNVTRQHNILFFNDLTISTENVTGLSVWDVTHGNAYATVGDNYLHVAANAMSVTFNFANAVTSFGLNITDWGEWGTGSLWYTDDLGNNHTIATTPLDDGNLIFFGVESASGISQITLHRDNLLSDGTQYDGFGMDSIYYQIAMVPAPGALALLGLAGLVGTRRRRN